MGTRGAGADASTGDWSLVNSSPLSPAARSRLARLLMLGDPCRSCCPPEVGEVRLPARRRKPPFETGVEPSNDGAAARRTLAA